MLNKIITCLSIELKLVYFLTIISVGLTFTGCGDHKTETKVKEKGENNSNKSGKVILSADVRGKIGLETGIVKEGKINGLLKATAKLIPNQDQEAQVSSLVQGKVSNVFVEEGDYVKAGQILMSIEGLEIGEIEAKYLQAKAMYEYSKSAFERQKTLSDQNVGSKKALLEAKAEYEKALAEFNAEDKRIHSIGLKHSDIEENLDSEHSTGVLTVKAPITGIVTERKVVIGQFIEPNSIAFRIMNISNLWAEGQIYEKDLPKVSGKPKVEYTTSAYPDEKFQGEVILIGQTVDEHTRTIKVRASLQNTGNKLKPNMFGELFIPINSITKGIVISTNALVNEGSKKYVFLVENDSTFIRHYVENGEEFDGMIEITSGLNIGDKIVTNGIFFLKSELMKESFGEADND